MNKYVLFLVGVLLVACKKESNVDLNPKTLLKLSFFDEFTERMLDSVKFEVIGTGDVHLLTKENPFIHDLPKRVVQARINKDGFVIQDYEIDFTNRDTINDNIVLKYDKFILQVPQDSLFASKSSKKYSFQVKRNAGFNIQVPSWIRVDTTNVSNFMVRIDVNIFQNDSDSHREGEIVLSHEGSRRIIPVIQYRKNRISTAYAKVGDMLSMELEMEDNFEGFPSIRKLGDLCLSEIRYDNVEGKSINFTTGCVYLTAPMDFKIFLKNKGGTDTIDLPVKFYDKKIELNPYDEQMNTFLPQIVSADMYYVDNGRKRIGVIDVADFVIKKRFTLPVLPKNVVYNPYNMSYYLLSDDDKIRKIDIQNGAILETFTMPIDPIHDHPQYPKIIPKSLVFNKDGFGLISTGANGSSGNGFRSLDTKNNNQVDFFLRDIGIASTELVSLLPNQIDFLINMAYSNEHMIWKTEQEVVEKNVGKYYLLQYRGWAINQANDLIDFVTKDKIASALPFRPGLIDKTRGLFYGISYNDRRTYVTQTNTKGEIINRIPSYEVGMQLSADGKYLLIYDSRATLYRVNTAILEGKFKVEL